MAETEDRLRTFIRRLMEQRGERGRALTLEQLGDQLGVTSTTVEKLKAGRPSRREKTRDMADRGRIPRTEFLWSSGYVPDEIDFAYDAEHYGVTPQVKSIRQWIDGYGRVISLEAQQLEPGVAVLLNGEHERTEGWVDLIQHYQGNLAFLADREVPCSEGTIRPGEIVIGHTTEESTDQQFGPLLLVRTPTALFCSRLQAIDPDCLRFVATNQEGVREVPRDEATILARVQAIIRTVP